MKSNGKLKAAAVQKIGTAAGKADRTAHKVMQAADVAKEELAALSKQVDALKRQLAKSTHRLRRALS